jgi:acyl-CoA thioester hydrolase
MGMTEPMDGHDGPWTAPWHAPGERVLPEWIDYNGHMNVGYYTFAFDRALDAFLDRELGMGEGFARRGRMGPFTLQNNLAYLGELKAGAPFQIRLQLLDHDAKRIHVFMEMIGPDGIAATAEQLLMNVDLAARRSAPYPDWAQRRLAGLAAAHGALPRPAGAGQAIGIRRKG